jgi:flavin-dependent dehydrogenase
MSADPLKCDVLIVGAGPAGLSVAAHLPDDLSVIIVHQDREIGRPVRTSGGSWLPDVERLGIPQDLYQQINTLDIYSDREHARSHIKSCKPVVLDVTSTYKWLARKSDHKNRKLLLSTKFLSAKQTAPNAYVSTIRSKTTSAHEIQSQYIIDASGHHCAVVEALQLSRKPERVGVGIEYEFPNVRNAQDRAILFVGEDALSGYGWIFPTPDQRLRVGIGIIKPDTDTSPRDLLERFLASPALAKFDIRLEGPAIEVNAGTLPSVSYDPQLVFGNVIRVGDAGNFATPTLGEGIRLCIELGEVLGRQLSKTIETGSKQPLRRYERTCRKRLAKNFWFGFRANKRMSSYSPEDWDRSVKRLKRLDEMQLVSLLRCEFTLRMCATAFVTLLRQKIRTAR